MADTEILYLVGFALIFIGALMVALAVLLRSIRSAGKGKVKAGGAVIIGPIPIVFGTEEKSLKTVLVLSIVLTTLVLAAIIVNYLIG